MIPPPENHHRVLPRERPCHLHRVLHRLGPSRAVVQRVQPPRHVRQQQLGQFEHFIVISEVNLRVDDAVELIPRRGYHGGMGVSGVHDAYPRREVEEGFAAGGTDAGSAPRGEDEVRQSADAPGDVGLGRVNRPPRRGGIVVSVVVVGVVVETPEVDGGRFAATAAGGAGDDAAIAARSAGG